MKKNFTRYIAYCILLFTLFVAACGSSTVVGVAKNPSPTHSPTILKTPGVAKSAADDSISLLKKSKTAMANLRSLHFELDAITQPETVSGSPAADLLQAFRPLPGTYFMETRGKGDVVMDLSRLDLTQIIKDASPGGTFTNRTYMQKDNVYLLGGDNNWYSISKEVLLSNAATKFDAEAGFAQVSALLDLALQKGSLHDEGDGTLGGKHLRHIQVNFQKDAFKELQEINVENTTFPGPSSTQFTNITDTTDFWIDASTGYLYQVTSKLQLDPIMMRTLSFQCSAFNQPVTIQAPTHVIPVSNIDQIPARRQ